MNVTITNRQRTRKINRQRLGKITRALLAELELDKAEIGICLVAAPEMTRLNETFLQHAGPTDVIAFDYAETGRAGSHQLAIHRSPLPAAGAHGLSRHSQATAEVSRPAIYGEIFVCVDEAVLQARKFGTSWQSEIVRYIVHGVLHLLGFDDSSAGARHKMKREENRRLGELSRRFTLAQLSRPARIPA